MTSTFAGFELQERIGRGGYGDVWRAVAPGHGHVALKVLRDEVEDDPDVRDRFRSEASLLTGRLPHVVPVRELASDGDRLGLVMDLLTGPDLRTLLDERGPLPLGEACQYASQVAVGLAGAHAQGVVHRDLKPENVVLDDRAVGRVASVSDFGVARMVDAASRTRQSRALGTVDYVAPEVLEGQPAGPGADVYALGVLLFEMLLGWRPFRGASPAAVIAQHLHGRLVRPDGLPEDVWRLVEECLTRDPDGRPEAAGLAQRLSALAAEHGDTVALARTQPPPATPVGSGAAVTERGGVQRFAADGPPSRGARRVVLPVLAALVALLTLGGLAYGVTRPPAASPPAGRPTPPAAEPPTPDAEAAANAVVEAPPPVEPAAPAASVGVTPVVPPAPPAVVSAPSAAGPTVGGPESPPPARPRVEPPEPQRSAVAVPLAPPVAPVLRAEPAQPVGCPGAACNNRSPQDYGGVCAASARDIGVIPLVGGDGGDIGRAVLRASDHCGTVWVATQTERRADGSGVERRLDVTLAATGGSVREARRAHSLVTPMLLSDLGIPARATVRVWSLSGATAVDFTLTASR